MKQDKYLREIEILCPVCGSSSFEVNAAVDGLVEMTKCASCGREATKDELLRDSSENLAEHVKEMGSEILKDTVAEMRASMRKALRGSKYIKFR
ncbi:MAG: hypothetical protein AB7S74_01980 [Hyphomicrobium sp.]